MDIKDIKVGDRVMWSGEPSTVKYVGSRLVIVVDNQGDEYSANPLYVKPIPAPPAPREPKCGDVVEAIRLGRWVRRLVTMDTEDGHFEASGFHYHTNEHGKTWRWPGEEK